MAIVRARTIIGVILLVALLVACSRAQRATTPTAGNGLNTPTIAPTAAGPQKITLATDSAATPESITAAPTSVNAQLFANPTEPAYVPGKGFSPDAQRTLDLATLQTGLARYRAAKGRYPPTLAALFPDFAPVADGKPLSEPPTDPITRRPYDYQVSADGLTYRLSTTMSSGKAYAVANAP